MAYCRLRVARFGERLTERGVEEDRVVTKSALAPRLGRDTTFHGSACFEQHAIALHERQRADESRGAGTIAPGPQRRVNQRKFFSIREVDTAEARRLNPGRAIE